MEKSDPEVIRRARRWLEDNYDEETKAGVRQLMEGDPAGLTEAFYRDLEFGTGGLRGIMGVGTNRMNKYTVGMATQGLANYLLQCFPDEEQPAVAIAYDSRHRSDFFAGVAAGILSANGIKVFLFDRLRPIPVLSFAVRHFGCQAGIVITASHNPKEYNGYKVFWEDGGQVVPPHDENIIREVQKIRQLDKIRFDRVDDLVELVGQEFDAHYIDTLRGHSMGQGVIARQGDMPIVFSPIHGSAVHLAPAALAAFGFRNVIRVPEQEVVSGDFPTVTSPNPEEAAALRMALDRARDTNAELVMATDPDGDRVGVAVPDGQGGYVLLNGNQTATLMIYYLLEQWKARGQITGKEYLVKTIVTTELLKEMAGHYGVACYDVLTGFKYIGELIGRLEGEKTFIAGGEESYGYLVGDYIRDKDAIISCCIVAEAAAWARDRGKSMLDLLAEVYMRFGFYHERLLSVTRKGKAGLEEIQAMMDRYRDNPPALMAGRQVVRMLDYLGLEEKDLRTGGVRDLAFPPANVLQFFLEDGTKVTMRPSGTEPKIKFYVGVRGALQDRESFGRVRDQLDEQVNQVLEGFRSGGA